MGHLGKAERLVGAPTLPDQLAVLAAVVDISDDAVISLDATRHITSWNRSAERVVGHSETAIAGRAVALLFPAHLRADVTVLFETVAAGDRVNHFETEIQRHDGMLSPISLSACPIVGVESTVVAVA